MERAKNKLFYLRIIISIIVIFILFEYLAKTRFAINNPFVPVDIRSNFGLNSYEAMHLKPNVDLTSVSGLRYKTDEYGFRTGDFKKDTNNKTLLLGGDSRIFGFALGYKDTVSSYLEEKKTFNIYQQAFPGSSPALFNFDIFEKGKINKLAIKPNYVIYAYDRHDYYNDIVFEKELQVPEHKLFLRKLKIKLGGFAWSMCMQKYKKFLQQTNHKNKKKSPENKKETKSIKKDKQKVNPINLSVKDLNALKENVSELNIPLIILYLPRANEFYFRDPTPRNNIKQWCHKNNIQFIDAYTPLDDLAKGDVKVLSEYFLDLYEGIHFSAKGSEYIAKLIEGSLEVEE